MIQTSGQIRPRFNMRAEVLHNQDFFKRWVEETLGGDYEVADAIVGESMTIVQTFMDAGWPPAPALIALIYTASVVAAQSDMDSRKFQTFLNEQFNLTYDCAKFMIQTMNNEMPAILKRELDGPIVDIHGREVR